MPKKLFDFFKQYLPEHGAILENKYLNMFGGLLHNPYLWHLNRHSVATAFSVGLFAMMMPVPFQMVLAAALAIIFGANLPIAIALTWVSNPVTTPPILYFCYKLGEWMLQIPHRPLNIELSWDWLSQKLYLVWKPLLLGTFTAAITIAIIANITIRIIWRIIIVRNWKKRQKSRK